MYALHIYRLFSFVALLCIRMRVYIQHIKISNNGGSSIGLILMYSYCAYNTCILVHIHGSYRKHEMGSFLSFLELFDVVIRKLVYSNAIVAIIICRQHHLKMFRFVFLILFLLLLHRNYWTFVM